MQNNTEQKRSKVGGGKGKSASAAQDTRRETPQPLMREPSAISGDIVGHFQLGELGYGQAKVMRPDDGKSVRIAFEFVLNEARENSPEPPEISVDLVVGPANWREDAEVYEVKAVPMMGNSAIIEIPRQDLERIVHGGRAQFYGRVHTHTGEYYINKDGRPFENFEALL